MYYQERKTLLDEKHITIKDKRIVMVDDWAGTWSTIIDWVSLRKIHNYACVLVTIPVLVRVIVDLLRRGDVNHIAVITSFVECRQ